MKTLITIALILNGLTGIFAAGHTSSDSEKDFRNPQPVETFAAIHISKAEQAMQANFQIAEEAYVNDIPFNTGEVAARIIEQKEAAALPRLSDEAEINDIPFDTKAIAESHLKKNI